MSRAPIEPILILPSQMVCAQHFHAVQTRCGLFGKCVQIHTQLVSNGLSSELCVVHMMIRIKERTHELITIMIIIDTHSTTGKMYKNFQKMTVRRP